MADNFQDLSFDVEVKNADNATSSLDRIIKRLERVQELQTKAANGTSKKRGNGFKYFSETGSLTESDAKNAALEAAGLKSVNNQLKEAEKYQKQVIAQKELLNSATYEETRRMELANKERKNEIDQRIQQTSSTKDYLSMLAKSAVKVQAFAKIFKSIVNFAKDVSAQISEYRENIALLNVAYKDSADEIESWGIKTADAYRMSRNEVIKYAATYKELANSLGIADDVGTELSQTLVNLSYDLSAMWNKSLSDVSEYLQSGIFTGQAKSMYKLGINVSDTSINQLIETNEQLKALGINAQSLSQSDKVLARMIITLKSTTDSTGMAAKEINNLSRQFEMLESNFTNLKLALGVLIEEPLRKILVLLNAIIIAATNFINKLTGNKNEEQDDPYGSIAESADKASESVENLNESMGLANFDKFSTLSGGSSVTGTTSATSALQDLLSQYSAEYNESVTNAISDMNNEAERLAENLEGLMPLVIGLTVAFAGLKLVSFISNLGKIASGFKNVGVTAEAATVPTQTFGKTVLSAMASWQGMIVAISMLAASVANFISSMDSMGDTAKWLVPVISALTAALVGLAVAKAAASAGIAAPAMAGITAAAVAGSVALAIGTTIATKVDGFADGGFTNANLIMTHENGKREWVGKAAGSSAIVNDTQMSDIMETAVARGVYNALEASSESGGSSTSNIYKFNINGRELLCAIEDEAKKQGKKFATR